MRGLAATGPRHDRLARPGRRGLRRPAPGHLFRPRLPVRLRRLAAAIPRASARCRPSATAPRSRSSAPACAGMVAGLRADAARPQAGHLRGRPDRRPPALAALRGGRRRDRRARRHALSRSPRRAFYHYLDRVGLETRPFPNPLDAGHAQHGDRPRRRDRSTSRPLDDLPPLFREVADAWREALEEGASFTAIQDAIRARDVGRLKELWNALVPVWDDRSFYDFVATAAPSPAAPFRHREVFGQVGFGTGGWDTDFPNSMLEILRVVVTELRRGPAPGRRRRRAAAAAAVAPRARADGALAARHHARSAARRRAPARRRADRARAPTAGFTVTDRWGDTREYPAVLVTCQSWLLTTHIDTDEALFAHQLWMALDRTRYMQSSKTFVMVDRPFWKDRDPVTGRYRMSMTLTDRLTRGTYLFDHGAGQARRDLPLLFLDGRRAEAAAAPGRPAGRADAGRLQQDLPRPRPRAAHHRRPDHRLLGERPQLPRRLQGRPARPLPLQPPHVLPLHAGRAAAARSAASSSPATTSPGPRAGSRVRCTTGLNAVWGILNHLGGRCHPDNPGPGDRFAELAPLKLPD